MDDIKSIFSLAFSLFILMDPIGNVPVFISVLKNTDQKRQRIIIFRELLIALGIIVAFNYVGEFLLDALKVSQDAVLISGGIILFLIALKLIFPSQQDGETPKQQREKEPLIVPLAIPLVAGPAVLAAVMIYSKQESSFVSVCAIIVAWIASAAILLSSIFIRKVLGSRGILACERLMGLILTLISIQMFLQGVALFSKNV
jgi:multiple antibiotic resistance protein